MLVRPRIIPVLLIDDRDLVKTKRFADPTYLGDPVNAVKIFNIKRVDEIVILDISATRRRQEPDYDFIEDIASQAFMPLSYGGGISSLDQAKRVLSIGYEKVVLNTALIERSSLITEIADFAGSQSVVASIDAKRVENDWKCVISDGSKIVNVAPSELAQSAERLGAGEIFLNCIDRDGTYDGYDIDLVRSVADNVSIPVTACGGAKGIHDLKNVLQVGHAHAAAAGSMFVFYGRLHAVLIQFPTEDELFTAGIYQ